jgi:plastocyanin
MVKDKNEMASLESKTPSTDDNDSDTNNATKVSIVPGATTLGDKAYSPNHLKIKVGSTVLWTNDDSNMHTVTSGTPDSADAGASFDSGITSLLTTSKTFAHKFTNIGEFNYFCRIHPTMVGEVEVLP